MDLQMGSLIFLTREEASKIVRGSNEFDIQSFFLAVFYISTAFGILIDFLCGFKIPFSGNLGFSALRAVKKAGIYDASNTIGGVISAYIIYKLYNGIQKHCRS